MTENIVNRALKLRLYPSLEQRTFLNKSFGCSRLFYNYLLNERNEFYKNEIEPIKENIELKNQKYKSFKATTKKQFKEKFEFAKECSDDCLCTSERNLQSAFNRFFKSLKDKKENKKPKKQRKDGKLEGYPCFKSKKEHRDSFADFHFPKNSFDFHHRLISISKCKNIKFRHREKLPKWYDEDTCVLKSITISKNPCGEYYASLLFELPNFNASPKPIDEKQAVGLDWSPSEFYIDSECHSGKDYGYEPQKQKHHKRLARLQQSLSRKADGSRNREKARIKVARLEKHISDCRKWWIENESLRFAKTYSAIGIEDLNLKGIARFLRNAKNINDCGWANFATRLIQKGDEKGCSVIKADRYFPSSKLCHCCGYVNHNLKLSDREWTCPQCGTFHIRDHNAALNLKNNALKFLIPVKRGEFRSVEELAALALTSLKKSSEFILSNQEEAERTACERVHKAYAL